MSEYWQKTERRLEQADIFLRNPSKAVFDDWIETFPWYVERFIDSDQVFTDMTPQTFADMLQEAAETGDFEDILEIPGVGMVVATEMLAAIKPAKFVPFTYHAEIGLEALQYDPPHSNTSSLERYEEFVKLVEDALNQYAFREHFGDVPDWATNYQVVSL